MRGKRGALSQLWQVSWLPQDPLSVAVGMLQGTVAFQIFLFLMRPIITGFIVGENTVSEKPPPVPEKAHPVDG